MVLVVVLNEVEELGGGFHHGEGGGLRVVDQDGDAAIRIEAEEPFGFLDIGGDIAGGISLSGRRVGGWGDDGFVHQCCGPLGAVDVSELLEEDLCLLAIGCALGDEVEALLLQGLAIVLCSCYASKSSY